MIYLLEGNKEYSTHPTPPPQKTVEKYLATDVHHGVIYNSKPLKPK